MSLRTGFLPTVAYLCTLFASAVGQNGGPSDQLTAAHGALMAVSFVAILPISVIFAATRDRLWGPSIWFQTHRALNLLAAVIITVGTILGIIAWTEISDVSEILLAHMVIGLILFAFVIIQLSALKRPSPKSSLRRVWAPVHHNLGRMALLLGFANAIIGTYAAAMDADWYIWICVVWGVIVLVGIALIAYSRTRPVRPSTEGSLPHGTAAQPQVEAKNTTSI